MTSIGVRALPPRIKGDRERVRSDILEAARELVREVGADFTAQELVKRAGVALQTFYRHFGGKDQLLLAVIESEVADFAEQIASTAPEVVDPFERLRLYISLVIDSIEPTGDTQRRFITSQRWRLHELYPDQVDAAIEPFARLILRELEAAVESGQAELKDPENTAWIITRLVMTHYHHYAFKVDDPHLTTAAEDIWEFCLRAIGGVPAPSRAILRRRRRR